MASLESSIPPSAHCSAATSCGGVRSKSSFLGAISATLTRSPFPFDSPCCRQAALERICCGLPPFLADGSDILAVRHAGHQVTQWTGVWTKCADTPTTLCAAWGQNCGNDHPTHNSRVVNRENAIH